MPPLPTFASGDPAGKLLNAATLNEIMRRLKEADRLNARTRVTPFLDNATFECLGVNSTGATIDEFSIVRALSVPFAPANLNDRINFQRRPVFDIDEPLLATDFPIITLEPIPDGGVGRVAVGGIAIAKVNFSSSGHIYANPTPSDMTRLTSSSSQGYMRVLWKESGTGNKWAAVTWEQPSGTTGRQIEIGGLSPGGGSVLGELPPLDPFFMYPHYGLAVPAKTQVIGQLSLMLEFPAGNNGGLPYSTYIAAADEFDSTGSFVRNVGSYTLTQILGAGTQPNLIMNAAMNVTFIAGVTNNTLSTRYMIVGTRPPRSGRFFLSDYTYNVTRVTYIHYLTTLPP